MELLGRNRMENILKDGTVEVTFTKVNGEEGQNTL